MKLLAGSTVEEVGLTRTVRAGGPGSDISDSADRHVESIPLLGAAMSYLEATAPLGALLQR